MFDLLVILEDALIVNERLLNEIARLPPNETTCFSNYIGSMANASLTLENGISSLSSAIKG